jgi:hypothetical protein
MRLMDFQMSIVRRFGGLPYPAYLCSMTVILDELRESYKPFLTGSGLSLSSQTADAARLAARPGSPDAGEIATKLMQEWRQLMDDPQEYRLESCSSLKHTFHSFAGEMAGEWPPYSAVSYVTDAATELPTAVTMASRSPQLVKYDYDEEVDGNSPGVQMLRKFISVIRFAEEKVSNGIPCEPDEFRATVFG